MVPLTDYETIKIFFMVILIVGIAAFITGACRIRKCRNTEGIKEYSYTGLQGPSNWKVLFVNSCGAFQSPININLSNAIVVPLGNDGNFRFSEEYNVTPREISVYNDGNSVILYADFFGSRPDVTGGADHCRYEFLNAYFRWGPTDHEGSEHTVNCQSYAMEFQAVHIKDGRAYCNLDEAVMDGAVLIISYLYQESSLENAYLIPLIEKLPQISIPRTCTIIEPVPLSFFMPPFVSRYVSYYGSLTFPPCTEGVRWIIQTEPLAISSNQVAQFRRLQSFCGTLNLNRRPVQNVNCREIISFK